ncbi:MAG: UPF0158 family protein [Crocosphaera sp.]
MTTLANITDIEQISDILDSDESEGFYGYIDRETGEVIVGHQDYDVTLDLELDPETEEFEERYLTIDYNGSSPAYDDMVNFTDTVFDVKLKNRLQNAINNKKPFANFKSIIKASKEIQRWYDFKSECRYQRAKKWLTDNNIKLPST